MSNKFFKGLLDEASDLGESTLGKAKREAELMREGVPAIPNDNYIPAKDVTEESLKQKYFVDSQKGMDKVVDQGEAVDAVSKLELPTETGMVSSLKSAGNKALDILGRPNAAIKRAAYEYMAGNNPLQGLKQGLTEESDKAPSGEQIAEMAREKYDIQNPLALAAIDTASEFVDIPTPAGLMGKLGKVANLTRKEADIAKNAIKMKGQEKLLDLMKNKAPKEEIHAARQGLLKQIDEVDSQIDDNFSKLNRGENVMVKGSPNADMKRQVLKDIKNRN